MSCSAWRSPPRSPGRPALIVLDEPTSQLDPVAGDELIALLRRLNEDSEASVVICEHRLERCLSIADRVIAMDEGRIVCDAPPREFLAWACEASPALATPGARLLQGLGLTPAPGVKAARAALRADGYDVGDAAADAMGGLIAGSGRPPRREVRRRATPRCGSTACGTRSRAVPRSCAAPRSRSAHASASR